MTTPPYGTGDTSYQTAGGFEGLQKLVEDFYTIMDTIKPAKTIRDMHPAKLQESKDKLARFLSGWTGGPKLYREKYGPISIPQAHSHMNIGSSERDAWLLCMEQALAKQPYPQDFKEYLLKQLGVPAERCRNQD